MNFTSLKGEKKIQAILSLATNVKNADLLFSLVASEKGNAKQAVLQALATFDYQPALPIWQKLIKSKTKGEKILLETTVDTISDIVVNEFVIFLSALFNQPNGYALTEKELTDFKTFISLTLGKGSEKMQELYWFVAENTDKLSSFNYQTNSKGLLINDYIHFYNPTSNDVKKIFPAILSMSILKTLDERLIKLANELSEKYADNWLSSVFISKLLTEPSKRVLNTFSKHLKDKSKAGYLYDTFGALYFDKKIKKHVGLLFWGQYEYGKIDTRFSFSRPLFENLDERWFELLSNQNQDKVTLQVYNRGGVLYEAYDEMLTEILPNKFQDINIEQKLKKYFIKREKQHNSSSTLYLEALNTLNCDISEKMIERFIECKDNAVSKYSLNVEINKFTNWTNKRKLEFYQKLSPKFVLKEEIARLKKSEL